MKPDAKPLYRKVNTRTHSLRHGKGGEARWDRNTKAARNDDRMVVGTRSTLRHGRDYTPLFRFLLSKVGEPFDAVHAAAVARLDDPAPIFWMVAPCPADIRPVIRYGESSYFSGLHVDEHGRLAKVDPTLDHTNIDPSCACCTHTFNGERFTRAYRPPAEVPGDD